MVKRKRNWLQFIIYFEVAGSFASTSNLDVANEFEDVDQVMGVQCIVESDDTATDSEHT